MVVRAVNRRGQADTGPDSPTQTQQSLLAWLDELGPSTISALAAAEHVRQQSVGQTVNGLVDRRWVARRRERDDRRRVRVSLTAEGRAALERGRTLRQTWLSEAIAAELDDAEREQLAVGLDLLARVVAGSAEG